MSAGMIVQCSKRRKRKKKRRRDRRSLSIMFLSSQSRKMGENKTVNRKKKIKRIKLQAESKLNSLLIQSCLRALSKMCTR